MKFHRYLLAKWFILQTTHKPLGLSSMSTEEYPRKHQAGFKGGLRLCVNMWLNLKPTENHGNAWTNCRPDVLGLDRCPYQMDAALLMAIKISIYLSISWDLPLHALAYLTPSSQTVDHTLLVRILKSFLQRMGFITWRLPHIILLLMVKWREQCNSLRLGSRRWKKILSLIGSQDSFSLTESPP